MMKPAGWFQIGWSSNFASGAVVPKTFFGQDLAVYRTGDGELHALDAYCGHMGAHLGYGGSVDGSCVTCPFHGWEWNAQGENTRIPYQDRPNRAVRIRSWEVVERNEVVYLWHHYDGLPPEWDVPDVFDALGREVASRDYHSSRPDGQIEFGRRTLDPYVVLDNAADPAHFATVHRTPTIPTVVDAEADGHLFRVRLGFGASWERDPEKATGDALDILEVGVGLSFTALGGVRSPYVVIVLATTPVDDDTSEMFQTVWLERAPGDDEPGRLAERMHHATHQLPRDIEIWEHQRYVERPAWAANEVRGFQALRRWASGFYAAV
jgi:phenylpropionate dioxygenase-like ring-hydroxylating dioxygenase large terminal subunit